MNYPKISTPLRLACILLATHQRGIVNLAGQPNAGEHELGLLAGSRMVARAVIRHTLKEHPGQRRAVGRYMRYYLASIRGQA